MQGIDLFSGAGGMSTGAAQCGVDIRYAVEFDPFAAQTFAINHSNTHLFDQDIRKINGSDFSNLDKTKPIILFGGPPCQGFSTSNQKNRGASNEKKGIRIRLCLRHQSLPASSNSINVSMSAPKFVGCINALCGSATLCAQLSSCPVFKGNP